MSSRDSHTLHSTSSFPKETTRNSSSSPSPFPYLAAEVLEQSQYAMNGVSLQAEPSGGLEDEVAAHMEDTACSAKGKQNEPRIRRNDGPLELLDLPLDILKCIIKEVTHTNDLTSLALTNSALNSLAIPHIYSRFDIVWPDAHASSEPRSGVDALTYGLATLVMREDLFDYMPPHSGGFGQSSCLGYTCNHCGMANDMSADSLKPKGEARPPRRGNLFSQFTRKFSLGNGPADWVQEYLISKEGGKMLGTLIALTLARMPNLETLIWDMPTGIVREVWHALASLGERRPGHRSRLDKVWVRLPDNREVVGALPLVTNLTSSNATTPLPAPSPNDIRSLDVSYSRMEHPNFSILPALKSLSVLELDELAYLKEISVLVHRSRKILRELRLGLSKAWAPVASKAPSIHLDSPCRATECFKEAGVIGLVMNEIYDCRKARRTAVTVAEAPITTGPSRQEAQDILTTASKPSLTDEFSVLSMSAIETVAGSVKSPDSPEHGNANLYSANLVEPNSPSASMSIPAAPSLWPSMFHSGHSEDPQKQPQIGLQVVNVSEPESINISALLRDAEPYKTSKTSTPGELCNDPLLKRLMLETFELERIPLAVTVLLRTIDWSSLTTLTLLDCGDHERLWKSLRRIYSPKSTSLIATSLSSSARQTSQPQLRRISSSRFDTQPAPEYRLKIKKIHTDNVSPSLISFLKETLAPNTLETMILQEHGQYVSPVTVDAIYRGPLRHHRSSLKKVSIDSSESLTDRGRSTKWKKWMLNHDILTFVTSGKMSSLRELGMALDHKDWHYFLQRLPNIPHLRSLYIPHIANHVYNHHLEAKELALQIVDLVIALRPEIELCYMGILTKCFEILENRNHGDSHISYHDSRTDPSHGGPGGIVDSDEDSNETDDDHDEDEGEDDDDDDSSEDGQPTATGSSAASEGADSEAGNDSAGDTDDDLSGSNRRKKAPRFRLREILFYDDKISIFKARHGRL